MDVEKLKEYMKAAVELESRLYVQKNAISKLDAYYNSLGKKKRYTFPNKPTKKSVSDHMDFMSMLGSTALGAILLIAGALLVFSCDSCGPFEFDDYSRGFYGYPAMVVGAIFLIIGIGMFASAEKANLSEYNDEIKNYEANVAHTDKLIADDERRVSAELVTKEHVLTERTLLFNKYNETKDLLQTLYDLDVIFKKYRNFVAVCSFYEYLLSGRCTSLDGHEGAYNIFENEIRLDRIVTKLDDVISHLEKIERNQYTLYDAINEGNNSIKKLVDQTKKIAVSSDYSARQSAITAENSRWAAEELNTLKWIEIVKLHQ